MNKPTILSNESRSLIEEAIKHYQEHIKNLGWALVPHMRTTTPENKPGQMALLSNLKAKADHTQTALEEFREIHPHNKTITELNPNSLWKPILQLPSPKESDKTEICVVVWQDTEHPTDQGVEVSTLEKIREGKYEQERVQNAHWRSLEDAFEQNSPWKSSDNLPPQPKDIHDDWDERGVVAYKEGKKTTYELAALYQVRDGDYTEGVLWLTVMDAPPIIAFEQNIPEED